MNLHAVAKALEGEVTGGQVLCPGPGHSRKDRSVTVRLSPGAPDGLLVWSHGSTTWQAAKDHVLDRLGVPPIQVRRPSHLNGSPEECDRRRTPRNDDPDLERRRRALGMWHSASDPRGTLAERYLASRALALPDLAAGEALRFHASCAFGEERLPVMIAALRCIHTNRLQAVHRTALTAEGAKIGRKMFGPAGGAAVKLDADEEVTTGLTIGEGIETCLAARQLGFRPVWALGSVGGIRAFPVLPGIEALVILAESDDGGASEAAVQACGDRWHAAGREVTIVTPRVPGDMNDAIRQVTA